MAHNILSHKLKFLRYKFSFFMRAKSFLNSEFSWARRSPQVQTQPSEFQGLFLSGPLPPELLPNLPHLITAMHLCGTKAPINWQP